MKIVKYSCDLCQRDIERLSDCDEFLGYAYEVEGLNGLRQRIDLCDTCLAFIRRYGHPIETKETK